MGNKRILMQRGDGTVTPSGMIDETITSVCSSNAGQTTPTLGTYYFPTNSPSVSLPAGKWLISYIALTEMTGSGWSISNAPVCTVRLRDTTNSVTVADSTTAIALVPTIMVQSVSGCMELNLTATATVRLEISAKAWVASPTIGNIAFRGDQGTTKIVATCIG